MKYIKKIAILVFAWAVIVELVLCVAFKFVPILNHKYYSAVFESVQIPKNVLGWDLYDGNGRPDGGNQFQKCGEVYGDSFTHGDEVVDSDVWVNKAGLLAKCRIINYGVSGYGLDQAYIKLAQKFDKNDSGFIAIGIYTEMLRRNMAGSWLFYADSNQLPLKPYFTENSAGDLDLNDPSLVMPNVSDIKKFHRYDKYYEEYEITWPYVVWAIKNIVYQYDWHKNKNAYLDNVKFIHPYSNDRSSDLAKKILIKASSIVGDRKLIILFYPTPDEAYSGWYPYSEFLLQVHAILPNACIVNTGPALHAESMRLGGPLKAPNGHYDVAGNKVIATEFFNAMKRCAL